MIFGSCIMDAKSGIPPAGIPGNAGALPPAGALLDTEALSATFCFAAARDCLIFALVGSFSSPNVYASTAFS